MTRAKHYLNPFISYQKVINSKGELTGTSQCNAVRIGNDAIMFTWLDNSGHGLAKTDDRLLAVIYNNDKKCFKFEEQSATRNASSYSMGLPSDWLGDNLHSWMAFVSAVKKVWANSMYLGESYFNRQQIKKALHH